MQLTNYQTIHQTVRPPSVTFAVDPVTPAKERLREVTTLHAVKRLLDRVLEHCADDQGMVVLNVDYHPLLAAVYLAFSQHRPLVLTPDAVWITIVQGVAHHMAIHGERLRPEFVAHQGQLDITFDYLPHEEAEPGTLWSEAFAAWAGQIRRHVGRAVYDTLICDFSTTGPVERTVSQIAMMDVFQRYFHYIAYCICGIPSVTLTGTPADWQHLTDKVVNLGVFDLDWWLIHLLPICAQFARASRGDVELAHWQNICKRKEEYGGDIVNGWIAKLFPYLRAFRGGACYCRNPIFETGEGFQTAYAPLGLSRVPFTRQDVTTGQRRALEAVGGFVGVTQEPQTLALQPKVGWAVCAADPLGLLLARLAAEHTTFPGVHIQEETNLPPDMGAFYYRTNGAALFGHGAAAFCQISAVDDLARWDWGTSRARDQDAAWLSNDVWCRFARVADGSWLAINLDPRRWLTCPRQRRPWQYDPSYSPICLCNATTQGQLGQNPVIAFSFTELLERLLDCGGRPYWLDPSFASLGDAERYTLRP